MNDARRRRLEDAQELIDRAQRILEDVMEEEREAYENLPEGLQRSERGMQMFDNADFLDDLITTIDACYCDITCVIEGEV